jgi:hypothetical protein
MDGLEDFVDDLGGVLEEWERILVSVVCVDNSLLLRPL